MKHRKKMLQYAQDAQVTDTPWEWWESFRHYAGIDCDWEDMSGHPDWDIDTRYRRKPQWKIDGKFKIGDRVTFAQKYKGAVGDIDVNGVYTVKGFSHPKGAEGDIDINGVYTVKGFSHPKGVRYYVQIGKDVSESFRDDMLKLVPQRLEVLSKAVSFDVPMPLQEAPEVGTAVYAPRPTLSPSYIQKTWLRHAGDLRELEMGFLHLTAENAEIHAKALAAISSPHFCP